MRGQPAHNTRPQARLTPSFLAMNAWMTSQLNAALICKLSRALMRLDYHFDMIIMGVCTTRHCQTSGRLVQELNVCTVHWNRKIVEVDLITTRHTHHLKNSVKLFWPHARKLYCVVLYCIVLYCIVCVLTKSI